MEAALPLLGYLFGCINGAYYTGKVMSGGDIRDHGSSNAGARNAGRIYGRTAFFLTVLIDALKTIIPLGVCQYLLDINIFWLSLTTIAILAGHIWPIQLQFRGGKGVVVYLAAALMLAPMTLIICGLSLGTGLLIKRNFTVAGLIALISVPFTLLFMENYQFTATFFLMLLVVLIAHIRGK
ncbi:glycerol-3-phosphate acyltransferase [Virgibacillus kekensis]|uniref:Glycerol-3-phosphate acyltransferase n=1 Tax=Virgibacillus kekensis TaxID=202261 RepID=A0ABV9DHJ1_9BACI